MTVKELIKKLQSLEDENWNVKILCGDNKYRDLNEVIEITYDCGESTEFIELSAWDED